MRAAAQAQIRAETDGDIVAIHQITEAAFRGRPYAGGDEQLVIDRLRRAGDLTLSLVAQVDDTVVGQVSFSPAVAGDGSVPWFALGPVAVAPELQGQGIGTLLIETGLARLRSSGALGCILTGNPAYYRRFGFEASPAHTPDQESAEFFMVNWFSSTRPTGRFCFHRAFYES